MALTVLDSGSVVRTLKTTEVSSIHTPHHKSELVGSTDENIITANTGDNVPVITPLEVKVNGGNLFYISFECNNVSGTMDREFIFQVPVGKTMHVTELSVTGLRDVVNRFEIREGSTGTYPTPVVPLNRNRTSSTASAIVVAQGQPTGALTGTKILTLSPVGGLIELRGEKLILKSNTTYSFFTQESTTPSGTVDVIPIVHIEWYEV